MCSLFKMNYETVSSQFCRPGYGEVWRTVLPATHLTPKQAFLRAARFLFVTSETLRAKTKRKSFSIFIFLISDVKTQPIN